MDERTELLARMWVVCDPNRMPSTPDEEIRTDGGATSMEGQPYWKWFVPRATSSLEYLKANGWKLVRDDGES